MSDKSDSDSYNNALAENINGLSRPLPGPTEKAPNGGTGHIGNAGLF